MDARIRFNVYIPTRLKRRIKAIADDKDMKMNDVVVAAIKDAVERIDEEHSTPDLVADRISEVLTSQIHLVSTVNKQTQRINELTQEVADLAEKVDGKWYHGTNQRR